MFQGHTSNYHIVGFTSAVGLCELRVRRTDIPGDRRRGSVRARWWIWRRGGLVMSRSSPSGGQGPTSLTFSGDKLLGGSRGILAGRRT
jgi:hypothetical protein